MVAAIGVYSFMVAPFLCLKIYGIGLFGLKSNIAAIRTLFFYGSGFLGSKIMW
jgi:hypothetical protein